MRTVVPAGPKMSPPSSSWRGASLVNAGERVVEIDPRDARRVDRGDLVLGRGQRAGDDAVAEVGLDLRPVEDVAGAVARIGCGTAVGGRDDQRRHVGRRALGQAVDPGADRSGVPRASGRVRA